MTDVIVDSNVILDVVTADPTWLAWSVGHLNALSLRSRLIVNAIVFAEVSARYSTPEEVDEVFGGMQLVMEEIPKVGLFLGGAALKRYRDSGGERSGILPDFLIGAHATVTGRVLLTRDRGRFRTYFPSLELITP